MQDTSFLACAQSRRSVLSFLLFEFFNTFADVVKRLLEVLSLLLQRIPFLFDTGTSTEAGWIARIRVRVATTWPAVPGPAPTKASSATTAKTATAAPASVSSTTDWIRIAWNRVTGAETCRSTCHWPHTAGTCTITTWHNQSPFMLNLIVLSSVRRTWGKFYECRAVRRHGRLCAHIEGICRFRPHRRQAGHPCGLDLDFGLVSSPGQCRDLDPSGLYHLLLA